VLSGSNAPTVGLLNIGEEAIKGNELIKQTGELLRAAAAEGDLNFYISTEIESKFTHERAYIGQSPRCRWADSETISPNKSSLPDIQFAF
jgi:hypothetical protein